MEYTDPERTANRPGDDGGTTVDMSARNPMYQPTVRATVAAPPLAGAHRGVHEEHVRSRGKWLAISGSIIGVFTLAIAVMWELGFEREMPVAYALPLYALALGAVSIGCMEYLSRPTRIMQERMIAQVAQLESNLGFLVELMDESLKQQYYRGVAAGARATEMTGTDNPRPTNRGRTGDVVPIRGRNSSPT
jgi:hypothetical protein